MNPTPSGTLLVVAGPSGVGKGTVVRHLKTLHPFWESVSYATRAPRANEQDGREYHFVDEDTFLRMREEGAFLESFEVYGEWKGTPLAPMREALAKGIDVLLEIDVQGALEIKRQFPSALLVFLAPPSMEELQRRITERAQDSEAAIKKRLSIAENELALRHKFDHVVTNVAVDRCAEEIAGIVEATQKR